MNRRQCIRVVGGGVILGATGVANAKVVSDMPASAVSDWNGPKAEMEVRRWALSYALLAPNPHNRQPWLVDLKQDNVIVLYCDAQRVLPETDPMGRQILIGHGCFLELLRIALAERGMVANISMFPDGEPGPALKDLGTKPVARITVAKGAQPDALFAHILNRHTQRNNFDTQRPVSQARLAAFQTSLNQVPELSAAVKIGTSNTADQIAALRQLCLDAAKVEIGTERTMMESMRLLRIGPKEIEQHRDGISMNAWFVRAADSLGLLKRNAFPAPGSVGHKSALERFEGHSLSAMGFVWLSTPNNYVRSNY